MNKAGNSISQRLPGQTRFHKLILVLSGVLLVQIVLTGLLCSGHTNYSRVDTSATLLDLDMVSVKKVTIEEANSSGQKPIILIMQKAKQGWVLPTENDFPVDNTVMVNILRALKNLNKGIPVANTVDSAERFKVGANNWQRRVTISNDKQKSQQLYLGSSPSYKSLYARLADSREIYCVDLAEYLVPTKASIVINKEFAKLNPYKIVSLSMDGVSMKENGNSWTLTAEGKEHTINSNLLRKVFSQAFAFPIKSLVGTMPSSEFNLENPDLVLKFGLKQDKAAGTEITYSFSKPKDKPYHVLKISNEDYFLEFEDGGVEAIKKLIPKGLLIMESRLEAGKKR